MKCLDLEEFHNVTVKFNNEIFQKFQKEQGTL